MNAIESSGGADRTAELKRSTRMALTSALFTGLSGLDVNQTRLNVVGNNIANVNTTASSPAARCSSRSFTSPMPRARRRCRLRRHQPQPARLGAHRRDRSRRISPPARSSPPAKPPTWPSTATAFSSCRARPGRSTPATARSRSTPATNSSPPAATSCRATASTTTGTVIPGSWPEHHHPARLGDHAKATENVDVEGNLNAGRRGRDRRERSSTARTSAFTGGGTAAARRPAAPTC